MKKWVILAIILAIGLVWATFDLYANTRLGKTVGNQQAVNKASQEVQLKSVTSIDFYHGINSYEVVYGLNDNEEELAVLVPNDSEQPLITVYLQEGWTKDQVHTFIKENRETVHIKSVRLGADEDIRKANRKIVPLWEVIYIDQDGRYTFHYLDFYDGSLIKRFSLRIEGDSK